MDTMILGIFAPLTLRNILPILPLVQVSLSLLFVNNGIKLTPERTDICPSMNVTLTCVTSKSNVSDLSFSVVNETLPLSNTHTINETAISTKLYFPPGTQHQPYVKVTCKKTQGENNTRLIWIHDDPVPISNLSCLIYDWSKNMTCTWGVGSNTTSSPVITVKWRIPHLDCGWMDCPERRGNGCYWKSTQYGDYSMKPVDFLINVRSYCGLETTTCYSIETAALVKPAAVTSLHTTVVNSTCTTVTWTTSNPGFEKKFKLWFTSKWNTLQTPVLLGYQTSETTLCRLIPATTYTVKIAVVPAGRYISEETGGSTMTRNYCNITQTLKEGCRYVKGSGYLSDLQETTVTTYSDVPRTSPGVSAGGWSWDPADCDDNRRSVTIYWQPINDIDKNGDLLAYVVTVSGNRPIHVAPDVSYVVETLLCNTEYSVTTRARNVNGSSPVSSPVTVLDYRKGVFPPKFMVEMSNSTDSNGNREVFVQWDQGNREDVTGYTVYWCKKEQGECAARTHIRWTDYDSSNLNALLLLQSPEDFLFGVSIATKNGSSGLTWEKCIYTNSVAPKRFPSSVEVHVGNEDNSLYVTWEKLTCVSGEPYIAYYTVAFCTGDSCDAQQTKYNRITLRNLAHGQYNVRVRGETQTKVPGPWSEIVQGEPVDRSWKLDAIVGLTIGCLFAFLVFVATLIKVVRRLRRRFTPPPIDLPDITLPDTKGVPDDYKDTKEVLLIKSQMSSESGYVEGKEESETSFMMYTSDISDSYPEMDKWETKPKMKGNTKLPYYFHEDYVKTKQMSTNDGECWEANSASTNHGTVNSRENSVNDIEDDLESIPCNGYANSDIMEGFKSEEDESRVKPMEEESLGVEDTSGYITEDLAQVIGAVELNEVLTDTEHEREQNEDSENIEPFCQRHCIIEKNRHIDNIMSTQ